MPTASPSANLKSQESVSPLNIASNLLIGIIPTIVTVVLVIMSPDISLRLQVLAVWSLCTILFALLDLLAERIEQGRSGGGDYLNLMASVAWLCLGLPFGLTVIVTGTGLASVIRIWFAPRLNLQNTSSREVIQHTTTRILVSGISLISASGVYALLNGHIPLREINETNASPLIIALAVGFISAQVLIAGIQLLNKISLYPLWSSDRRNRWLSELALFPLIMTLPPILYNMGLGVFIVIMSIVAAHAVRYRQISLAGRESKQLYQHSSDLIQKLSLVNRSVQNAMFNVDQGEALKTACNTAIAISQADKAAIFLANREQGTVYLAESINLDSALWEAETNTSYFPEPLSPDARVIADTHQATVSTELREFAQKTQFRAFAEMPLRSGNTLLGYMAVFHETPHQYTETELDLLEILANQLTAALDNTQLLRALEIHAFEMTHLVHLSRISTSSLDLARLAADVSDVLRQMTSMDWVMIVTLEKERMQILGMLGGTEERSETPTAMLPQFPEIKLLAVQDIPQPFFFQATDAGLSPQLKSFIELQHLQSVSILPMVAHDNLFGVIFLGTYNRHELSEREEQLLEAAANQIATQIYNVRVYKETHDALNGQLQQLALIEDIVQQISGSHDFNQIINDVFEAAVKTTQADTVALALLTDADDLWVIEQYYQQGVRKRHYSVQQKVQGVIGQVAQTGKIELLADNQAVDYYYASPSGTYQSSLAVPLMKDGTTVGVLNVESKQLGTFTHGEADFLKNLGGHAIISIENARLLEELQYQIATLTSLRALSLALSTAVDTELGCQSSA